MAKIEPDIEKFYSLGNREAGGRARRAMRKMKSELNALIREMTAVERRAIEVAKREAEAKARADDDVEIRS